MLMQFCSSLIFRSSYTVENIQETRDGRKDVGSVTVFVSMAGLLVRFSTGNRTGTLL